MVFVLTDEGNEVRRLVAAQAGDELVGETGVVLMPVGQFGLLLVADAVVFLPFQGQEDVVFAGVQIVLSVLIDVGVVAELERVDGEFVGVFLLLVEGVFELGQSLDALVLETIGHVASGKEVRVEPGGSHAPGADAYAFEGVSVDGGVDGTVVEQRRVVARQGNVACKEYFQYLFYRMQSEFAIKQAKLIKISEKYRNFARSQRRLRLINTGLFDMDIILGIESSCDDTSAAVIRDGYLLSNVLASQEVHKAYGGVIPELASRAHQLNIVPVVSQAIDRAGIKASDITAIAFTRGPGLLGSLLVGTSFAKGLALALDKPLVEVNHLQGHVLANFIKQYDKENVHPSFPYLCLLVSGGNSQIVKVNSPLDFEILGQTIDDAVGEAFDKCSKMMGLGYPGGPVVDRLAKLGDPQRFHFAKPHVPGLDYSFSGVKTSLLYFVRDRMAEDPQFMEKNKEDICAAFQRTLIEILMDKLIKAAKQTGIREVTIGGGVSANSGLRDAVTQEGKKRGWKTYLPEFKFTTDNAAMIAIAGYFHYLNGERTGLDVAPVSRIADF